jgi:transcription-repair coupling factor (superfamily II helicase)
VFYLHNRVQDLFRIAADLQKAFPDASVGVAHGRMSREEIEQVMLDFSQGKYQILVCTTIIETGLDIANANTIIIDEADRFGLSQLYQIRGRVGRRDKLAYCYLMVNPSRQLNEEANKRLKSIKEFTQLGSGYKIAMRDLTIRGAGDMLGPQQAGFIDQIGLDLYLEMLAEAIARKQGKAPEEKEPEKTAQIVKEGYIPERFTSNDGDKLQLYQEVKKIKTLQQLDEYEKRTADLFGKIPAEVASIFESRKLDLFVNQAHVDSLKENGNRIVIVMSQEYSRNIDGLRLFEAMNKASRQIKLSYHNSRIQVEFEKKKSYMPLLKKVIDILNDSSYYKRTK